MTDKEYKFHRARVRKSVAKWLPLLGLDTWRSINIIYKRDGGPEDIDVIASTSPDWEYKHATVTFYVHRLTESDNTDIDYYVRHEFSHILVNQMSTKGTAAKKNEERVVTELAMVFNEIFKAGAGIKTKFRLEKGK